VTEFDVKNWILKEFEAAVWAEEGPDIAVNAHASDPHYGRRRIGFADRRATAI